MDETDVYDFSAFTAELNICGKIVMNGVYSDGNTTDTSYKFIGNINGEKFVIPRG